MSVIKEIQQLQSFISTQIIGQQALVNRLLIALLADGHLLVEGAPGLAKTRAIKVLGQGIEGDFHRVPLWRSSPIHYSPPAPGARAAVPWDSGVPIHPI